MSTAPVVDPSTRLRTLIASVDHELAQAAPAPALQGAFAALVEALALGPEPEMRACPACQAPCRANAQRCGFCWQVLPALAAVAPVVAPLAKPEPAAPTPTAGTA
ncbi:MAG: hypothetical protein IPL61_38285 [Myxococcales bacterium]|nr:hypothetical protein [Myxococcales bacterium]